MSRSMVDAAYETLSQHKNSMAFADLWKGVCKEFNFSDDMAAKKISHFYTDLSTDSRFIQKNGRWQLKDRVKFKDVESEMNKLEIEEDDEEEISEGELEEDYSENYND